MSSHSSSLLLVALSYQSIIYGLGDESLHAFGVRTIFLEERKVRQYIC